MRICRCDSPTPQPTEGFLVCGSCGERALDPVERLMLAQQQRILELHERILERIGDKDRPDEPAAAGRLVTPAEMAERLGRSVPWVRARADELGVIRLGGGSKPRLWFDPSRTAALLEAAADGDPLPSPPPPRSKRRRRRSTESDELLPILGKRPA